MRASCFTMRHLVHRNCVCIGQNLAVPLMFILNILLASLALFSMFRFKLAEDNKPGPALYLKGKIKA